MSAARLSVVWIALAGVALFAAAPAAAKPAHKPKPAAVATPAQAKQIAKLEALTDTLASELAALEARAAAVAAKAATVPAATPRVLPFQGPAGGSLTGAYPEPRLAPGAVGTAELAAAAVDGAATRNRSLTGADVADGSIAPPLIGETEVGRAALAPGAGDALAFGTPFEYPGPGDTTGQRTISPGEGSVVITLSCPAGTSLLTGGWEWSDENGNGTIMFESHPREVGDSGNTTWEWRPKVRSNIGTENTFKPKLLCLLK